MKTYCAVNINQHKRNQVHKTYGHFNEGKPSTHKGIYCYFMDASSTLTLHFLQVGNPAFM